MLLPTRLAICQWDRADVSKLAVWVTAPTQCSTHTDLLTIDLLKPGFIKILRSRADGSRFGLGLGRGSRIRILARALGAFALASGRRRRRDIGSSISENTGRRNMLSTWTWLQTGWDILSTESHLIEAVSERPVVFAHECMNGLPDRPVSSQNLLKGRPAQRRVRRHRQGVMKEFVVQSANDKEVNNLQHRKGGGKDTQRSADSRLSRATRRNEGSRTGQILFTFQELTQELTVGAGTTAVLPRQGIRLRCAQSPGNPDKVTRGVSLLDGR